MQQIISITDARNNLSQLVKDVANQNKTVVIIRDSMPEAALVPYAKILKEEEEKEKLLKVAWTKLFKEGKKAGKNWAKKNKIDLKNMSESELYDIIDKI